jgi:magnesium transporter
MQRSIYYSSPDAPSRQDLSPEEMTQALTNPDGLLWVSFENAPAVDIAYILQDVFHFHTLAIEDVLSDGFQSPKIDDFSSYLFLIVHALPQDGAHQIDNTAELNIFLGPNYLVTSVHRENFPALEKVWQRITRDDRLIRNGSDFLCHAILDCLVDEYFPLVDQLDEEIEMLEDAVLAHPKPEILQRVLELKHETMFLRRIISPQREIINRLSRDDFPMIDRQSRIYYRDIYDHLVRIQDLTESLRDIISGLMDIYLNSTSLRLNEVMKALTIVSTIFLPLSFVAGVYGMNFQHFPEITWKYGYAFVWVVFISIAVAMVVIFKRRKWF